MLNNNKKTRTIFLAIFFISFNITYAQKPTAADAVKLYNSYQFDECVTLLEKLQDITQNELLQRAKLGQKLLKSVENVVFIDSVILDVSNILKAYPSNSEIGYVCLDTAKDYACESLSVYLSGKQDMKIFSQCIDNQTDLYKADKYLNEWDTIKLSSNVNTPQNDNYPFMLSDGVTLYFASQGHLGLGGYDIFMTRQNSAGEYLAPQNVGMPFNSPYNDYFMVIDELNHKGWFASDRFLPNGKVSVYQFVYNEQKTILTDTNINVLREKALKIKIQNKQPETNEMLDEHVVSTIQGNTKTQEIIFLLTEGIVYQRYSDFKNPSALEKFKELENVEKRILDEANSLAICRLEYKKATENEKSLWTERILHYEKSLQELDKQQNTLKKEVRRLELNP
jgi:hypothetical protein